MSAEQNWAKNYTYRAPRLQTPGSVTELQEWVAKEPKVKALGTRHSFNDIADTEGDLLSTAKLNSIVSLDKAAQTVTIESGVRYGELCRFLDHEGFALHNLASLPHISVAGACATGTHGSGLANGNLATAVKAVEIVRGDGNLISLSREANPEDFPGAVIALGALGVVARMTLGVQPNFTMQQWVFEGLPFKVLEDKLEEVMNCAYSVSLFTNWKSLAADQIWVKDLNGREGWRDDLSRATPAPHALHPIRDVSPEFCTEQMGVPGPWFERLPHFKLEFTPSSGEELQSEYFVPFEHGYAAIRAIAELGEEISLLLHVSEIRAIAQDDFWMSPCSAGPCLALHFTWKKLWPDVQKALPKIEAKLAKYGAVPHWGKLFTLAPETIRERVTNWSKFRDLAERMDPESKFRNRYLDAIL